jgi:hypothetical protein
MYDVGKDKLPSVTTILAATQSQEKQASLAAWRARVGTIYEAHGSRTRQQPVELLCILY